MARNQRNDEETRALSTEVQPPRLPYPAHLVAAGVSAGTWKALTDAVYPSAKTVDGVLLALQYCKARNLDPFKRPVHVVPMWNTALGREVETVWPGIGELRTTAFRTGKMAGVDDCIFGPEKRQGFEDKRERPARDQRPAQVDRETCEPITFPEWAQITVYRMIDGQRCAFVGPKVRFTETFSGTKGLRVPNARWQMAPFQMLEKCAEAAALRRAFPEELGDEATAEEMEGREMTGSVIDVDFFVIPEAQDGDERPSRPTRDSGKKDESKRPWSDAIDRELREIQRKADNTVDPAFLPPAMKELLQRHDKWPAAAKKELRRIIEDRIAFLKGDEPEHAGKQGVISDEIDAEIEGRDREEPDHEAYIGFLIDQVAQRIGNGPDINSFKSNERTALDQLPEAHRARAEAIFALGLRVTKDAGDQEEFRSAVMNSDAGAPAAAADPIEQAEEER